MSSNTELYQQFLEHTSPSSPNLYFRTQLSHIRIIIQAWTFGGWLLVLVGRETSIVSLVLTEDFCRFVTCCPNMQCWPSHSAISNTGDQVNLYYNMYSQINCERCILMVLGDVYSKLSMYRLFSLGFTAHKSIMGLWRSDYGIIM